MSATGPTGARRRLDGRALVLGLVLIGLGAVIATLAGPRPAALGPVDTGDRALAERVRAALDGERGHLGVSVALVEDGRVRTAGVGDSGGADHRPVDASTRFEIGSVAKPLTGMLLAQLAAQARVDPQAPLRTFLPRIRFEDPAVGSATLAELASHRSGLPRLPFGSLALIGPTASIRHDDPYAGYGPDAVIAAVAGSEAEGRGEVAYSNLGMAVLGQALAARAGTSYADLLDREILSPLGMDATTVVAGDAQPPSPSAQGRAANGSATAPWRGSGYTPAGSGVRSTADDMARLVAGAMESSAPGAAATEPRFARDEDDRIGIGWFIRRRDGREITWHNGRTGGFSSFVGVRPRRRTGRRRPGQHQPPGRRRGFPSARGRRGR